MTDTKTNILAPIAVSVLSPEEAKKANTEALAYFVSEQQNKDPFYNLYQGNDFDVISLEGTVKAVSMIPDPEKNDYPNCLYSIFVDVNSFSIDTPLSHQLSSEIIINIPIMKDNTIFVHNIFFPGDKISCSCTLFNMMPQDIQEIQLSDDIQSFEHEQYYAFYTRKINSFLLNGNTSFAKREITILPIQTLSKDSKATELRRQSIREEITRIENELKKHGGSFVAWKEEYKPIAEKYKQLCQEKWSGWLHDCFFAAGGTETTYHTEQYLKGILPYKQYLEENNIDLIILRCPSKADFAARVLASDDFQENPAWVQHYYECLKNDIEIIDPMPEMWKHRFDFPLFFFYHIPTESHPFEGQQFISAKVLSETLYRYDYKKASKQILLQGNPPV